MALSAIYVEEHIKAWQTKLTSQFYLHRRHWPAHLFHHAPIENAVAILKDGYLRSRNDEGNQRPRDVAAPGVIDARNHAHDRVRLYFRPKTPTQWHIEGIRKKGECTYGDDTHAGVLVMFLLDAQSVLTLPDVMFSDKNMQLGSASAGSTEEFFSEIPFSKVFSEGGTGGDRSITDARCAEVLPSSPLRLSDSLRAIYCRSEPERDTLLHMLGGDRKHWETYCHVSDALKVFQKEFTFVQELRLTSEGVIFRLNPRRDLKKICVKIEVYASDGRKVVNFSNSEHDAVPSSPHVNWIWKQKLADDNYLVEVHLEGCLAYQARVLLGDSLF